MNILLLLAVLAFVLVTSSAKEKTSEHKENRSKRVPNYYDPSYGTISDSNHGSPGSNYNDLYSPPQCKLPTGCRSPESIPVVDTTWVSSPRQYYVTMGSCFAQDLFAKVLLDRDPRTNQELKEMCLTVFLANGSTYFDGYDQQFSQNCMVPENGKGLKCNIAPENSDASVDFRILPTETVYLIDSDNSTYALYYRCINDRYEDVLLLTTRPYIERPVMSRVVNVMLKNRIPIDQIRPFQCCPPSYPFPFQNYLQNSCSSSQYSSQGGCSSYSSGPNSHSQNYDQGQHNNYNNPSSHHYPSGPGNYY